MTVTAATMTVQVLCIRKRPSHFDPHTRIAGIGGFQGGSRWYLTEDNAISGIDTGKYRFYTSVGGRSVWIVIASHNGRRYLKTEADGYAPNNLLSLPECP